MKPFFNHGWTQINTDGEKTLTRIARIFAKGPGLDGVLAARPPDAKSDSVYAKPVRLSDWIRVFNFLTTDCEPQWQTQINTDGEKTLTRISRIFAKGFGAGWGYLPYGRRTQLTGNHGGKAEG